MPTKIWYSTLVGYLMIPMMASAATALKREVSSLASTQASDISICILMLARDEQVLLRRNLPTWLPLLSPNGCIVGQVDDRSSDHSHLAFMDTAVIPHEVVPLSRRFVYHYSFDGLGPARSLMLQEAWYRFGDVATAASTFTDAGPLASHFFLVDPDWVFSLKPSPSSSLSLSRSSSKGRTSSGNNDSAAAGLRQELARTMRGGDELVQAFQIFDRNGVSSRWLDWFMRAQPDLQFKYRWHEMLSVAPERYTYVVLESFTVTETEGQADSYHSAESGGSMTIARYEREVKLLTKDHEEDPNDVRVLYYLGVDYSTILQLLVRQAAEAAGSLLDWRRGLALLPENAEADYQHKWETAVQYLRLRVWDLSSDVAHLEMAWASAFWLGKLLHELRPLYSDEVLDEEAARAYERCTEIDPERVECPLQQIRLMLDSEGLDAAPSAWALAQKALAMPEPERTFLAVPYHYTCTVPAVAARAAVALSTFMKSGGSTATSTSSSSEMDASSTQAEAEALIIRAHSACTQGVMDEAPSYLHELARAFEKLEEGGYEDPRQALKAKSLSAKASVSVASAHEDAKNLNPKKFVSQHQKSEMPHAKSTLAQAPGAKAAASFARASVGGIRKQAASVRSATASSPSSQSTASTSSSSYSYGSNSYGSSSSGTSSASTTSSVSASGSSGSSSSSSDDDRGSGSSRSGKKSALAAEIELAERESATRWLQLAATSSKEDPTASSTPGAPLSVDTVQLLVRALQAMPGDTTVQRQVAAMLSGSGDAPTAHTLAPLTAPLEGLSRVQLLAELEAVESRVALVLQAIAKSEN